MTAHRADGAAGFVRIERPAPDVAVIRIDRPERRNALSIAVRREIASAVAHAEADDAVRAMILAGGTSCFASGGDIVENARLSTMEHMHRGREKRVLWGVLASATKPLLAAVRGYALGGGAELMMLADIIVASRTARIGQPEPRVGIMPGSGGTQRLPRAVGKYAAMKVLLTGETLLARRPSGWVSSARRSRTRGSSRARWRSHGRSRPTPRSPSLRRKPQRSPPRTCLCPPGWL